MSSTITYREAWDFHRPRSMRVLKGKLSGGEVQEPFVWQTVWILSFLRDHKCNLGAVASCSCTPWDTDIHLFLDAQWRTHNMHTCALAQTQRPIIHLSWIIFASSRGKNRSFRCVSLMLLNNTGNCWHSCVPFPSMQREKDAHGANLFETPLEQV